MKHKSGFNALNMRSDRRKAVKRSMVTSVFKYERIKTTKARALEIRRMAEKMITRAKEDSVHNRRVVAEDIKTRQFWQSSLLILLQDLPQETADTQESLSWADGTTMLQKLLFLSLWTER